MNISKTPILDIFGDFCMETLQYGDQNSSSLKVDLENEFDYLFDLNLQIEEMEKLTYSQS